jgi:hypothetical protein
MDTYREIHLDYVKPGWGVYGLSIAYALQILNPASAHHASMCHDLVTQYLDTHQDAREDYLSERKGRLKYLDILKLAEEEQENLLSDFKELMS